MLGFGACVREGDRLRPVETRSGSITVVDDTEVVPDVVHFGEAKRGRHVLPLHNCEIAGANFAHPKLAA